MVIWFILFEQYQWPEKQGLGRQTIQQECTFYKNVNNKKEKPNKNQNAVPQVFLIFHCIEYDFCLSEFAL